MQRVYANRERVGHAALVVPGHAVLTAAEQQAVLRQADRMINMARMEERQKALRLIGQRAAPSKTDAAHEEREVLADLLKEVG